MPSPAVVIAMLFGGLANCAEPTFSVSIRVAQGVLKARSDLQEVFRVGSEVRIRLVFKNTSDHEIPYVRGPGTGVEPHGEIFTDVEVRDAKGELSLETKYHRALRGKDDNSANPAVQDKSGGAPATSGRPEPRLRFWGSFTGFMLKPGESREEDIVVSKLYDLSQPGQYTISASRRLSSLGTDPNSKVVAKSNRLMITITK
jgi:hypothetical protein